jgi:hypothetical protein
MWHITVIVLFRDKKSTNLVEIRLLSEDICLLSVSQVSSISYRTFSYFGEVYTPLSNRPYLGNQRASNRLPRNGLPRRSTRPHSRLRSFNLPLGDRCCVGQTEPPETINIIINPNTQSRPSRWVAIPDAARMRVSVSPISSPPPGPPARSLNLNFSEGRLPKIIRPFQQIQSASRCRAGQQDVFNHLRGV